MYRNKLAEKPTAQRLRVIPSLIYLVPLLAALGSAAWAAPGGVAGPRPAASPAGPELAHGGLSCRDCHLGTGGPETITGPPVHPCLTCHSPHPEEHPGPAAPAVDLVHTQTPGSPQCVSCHGHHDIVRVNSPFAPVYWHNVPRLCGSCHINSRLQGAVPQVPEYAASVHGRLALGATEGKRPAVCTDCHGIHPQAAGHPNHLLLARPAIPGTCGRCHQKEYAEYAVSSHGLAALRGDKDAAVCTDCHKEHGILPPQDKQSPVYAANIVATCGKCHSDANVVRLHNLPSLRITSYQGTYHGVANRYGDLRVANCVSCHGAHNILPASDPNSTVNPRNVAATCAECHPGAQAWVSVGQVHVISTGPQAAGLRLVRLIYRLFVFITLAMFFGYILLELLAFARERRRGDRGHRDLGVELLRLRLQKDCLLRMTWCERGQHYVLLITFLLLSISGVVLLIPDSDVARGILALSGGMSGRALVHRVAAGGLIALALSHVVWIATTTRGREVLRHMLPQWADVAHVLQTIMYLLGLSTATVKFDRFTFIEKFEYWAVGWGMFSMGVTGAVMTFTDWSLRHLPKWVWEACKIVHTWEALLAIITIAVWHLYHALWKPGGPNWSWVSGYLTPEQLAHEHALEFERLAAQTAIPGYAGTMEDEAGPLKQPDLP